MAVYLHIPFCQAKCTYCDFNTYVNLDHLFQPYVTALIQEARWLAPNYKRPVRSLFLGGGTPTALPIDLLRQVLTACFEVFVVEDGAEITCEANPGIISLDYLQALRNLGVNRLSLGAQSFAESELAMLGRIHNVEEVELTVRRARAAGFGNLSLDLIYGLPEQTLSSWTHSLERALTLGLEHISLYCLTLEEGTPLREWVEADRFSTPDPDLAADMVELGNEYLVEAGYLQYEISNWSLPGYECAHNLVYWRNRPYLGLGAGAHSSATGCRWWNVRAVQTYIQRVQEPSPNPWPSPAAQDGESIDRWLEMGETMMLGLRLVREGVTEADFRKRFGVSLEAIYGDVIQELTGAGLLLWDQDRLRLSRRGWLLGNQVFFRFLPPAE
jgi:oxygen-independent coproporphyrinogen-3 oxidase